MPDTGAPWNIPYVTSADLVSDWPADSLALANAIDAGLDAAGPAGIGSNVVTATNLVSFTTSSATFADVTDVTVTITPTSATSKIFVLVTGLLGHDDGNLTYVRLNRDGTDIALGSGGTVNQSMLSYQSGSVDYGQGFTISWLDSPATTSAVVYKLRAASSSGTGYVGRTGAINYRVPTVITAIEVAA